MIERIKTAIDEENGVIDKMVAIFNTISSSGQNGCSIFSQSF